MAIYRPRICAPKDLTEDETAQIVKQEKIAYTGALDLSGDPKHYPSDMLHFLYHDRRELYDSSTWYRNHPQFRPKLVTSLGNARGHGLAALVTAEKARLPWDIVTRACAALWEAGYGQDDQVRDAVQVLPGYFDRQKLLSILSQPPEMPETFELDPFVSP